MGIPLFRLTSLNLNGIRSAAKGRGALDRRHRPGLYCVQEVKAQAADVQGRFEQLAGLQGHFPFCREEGLFGRGCLYPARTQRCDRRLWQPEFDAEGRYLELRFDTPAQAVHHQRVLSQRLLGRRAAGGQVPLSGQFHPTSARQGATRIHPVRRREHRPPANRPENWRSNQKTAAFCPKSAPG